MIDAILMPDGMHAVPQGHVLNVQPVVGGVEHQAALCVSRRAAIFSAVRKPAEVMMSKFPA